MFIGPNVCFDIIPEDVDLNDDVQRLAGMRGALWENGQEIKVGFANDVSNTQLRQAQAAFEEWEKYANIDFVFGKPSPDIRVTFDPRKGAWSHLGKNALRVPDSEPTMNLGFNQGGTYLHEVGHALGMIHEHQNPEGGFNWNWDALIRDLGGPPNNWNEATIRRNMQAYDIDRLNATRLDEKSIMIYPIPAHWTTDGRSVQGTTKLSDQDKAHIATLYPGRGKVKPNPPKPVTTDCDLLSLCDAFQDTAGVERGLIDRIDGIVKLIQLLGDCADGENLTNLKKIVECLSQLDPQEASDKTERIIKLIANRK